LGIPKAEPQKQPETALLCKDSWIEGNNNGYFWGCHRRDRGNCCDLQQWENVKGSCKNRQFMAESAESGEPLEGEILWILLMFDV